MNIRVVLRGKKIHTHTQLGRQNYCSHAASILDSLALSTIEFSRRQRQRQRRRRWQSMNAGACRRHRHGPHFPHRGMQAKFSAKFEICALLGDGMACGTRKKIEKEANTEYQLHCNAMENLQQAASPDRMPELTNGKREGIVINSHIAAHHHHHSRMQKCS